ncbi:MAG: hypothetical protein HYZ79_06955 [Candidatus Melainabacteria bacterium]|nr:hypothetical protein [Candidatus Melainabacteria bacterium]
MLSDEEKSEFIKDGLSSSRRKDFSMGNDFKLNLSLDEYMNYLDDIQKIFGEFKISQKITKCDLNKL